MNKKIEAEKQIKKLVGRFEEAIEQFRKTLEMNPDFPFAYIWQGLTYWGIGENDKALASLLRAETLAKEMAYGLGFLGMAYALTGQKNKVFKMLEKLDKLSAEKYVSPMYKAFVYIGLDLTDKAFEYIEKAYVDRETFLFYMKIIPMVDNLRPDSRFDKIF